MEENQSPTLKQSLAERIFQGLGLQKLLSELNDVEQLDMLPSQTFKVQKTVQIKQPEIIQENDLQEPKIPTPVTKDQAQTEHIIELEDLSQNLQQDLIAQNNDLDVSAQNKELDISVQNKELDISVQNNELDISAVIINQGDISQIDYHDSCDESLGSNEDEEQEEEEENPDDKKQVAEDQKKNENIQQEQIAEESELKPVPVPVTVSEAKQISPKSEASQAWFDDSVDLNKQNMAEPIMPKGESDQRKNEQLAVTTNQPPAVLARQQSTAINKEQAFLKRNEVNLEKYIQTELTNHEKDWNLVIKLHANKRQSVASQQAQTGRQGGQRIVSQGQKEKRIPYTSAYEVCCEIDAPYSFCLNTSEESRLDEFGVGVVLYFKLLKHMSWCMLLYFILSIPAIFISLNTYQQSASATSSLSNLFTATTIGAIGLERIACYSADVSQASVNVDLTCKNSGQIQLDSSNFFYGVLPQNSQQQQISEQGCEYVNQNQLDTTCSLDFQAVSSYLSTNCQTSTCNISPENLISIANCSDSSQSTLYIGAICQNQQLEIFGVSILPALSSFLIASFDAFIIVLFVITLQCLRRTDVKTRDYIMKEEIEVQNFAIQTSNLPLSQESQLKVELKRHYEYYLNRRYKKLGVDNQTAKVLDVRIAETSEQIYAALELSLLQKQKRKLILKFVNKYDFANRSTYKQVKLQKLKEVAEQQQSRVSRFNAQRDFKELVNLRKKIDELHKKHSKKNTRRISMPVETEEVQNIKYAYITFNSNFDRNNALDYFQLNFCERNCACCNCCIKEKNVMKNKLLLTDKAPNPNNIAWENIYFSGYSKRLRRLLSWVLSLAVLAGSFAVIAIMQWLKTDLLSRYPNTDCSQPQFAQIDVNYVLNQTQGYVQCYCQQRETDIVTRNFDNQQLLSICTDWFENHTLQNSIPYLVALIIVAVNIIVVEIFSALSEFEKHKYQIEMLASRMIKNLLAQFINTGLILLLTNISFSNIQNNNIEFTKLLFSGSYSDFSAQWYQQVGSVILLTMMLNIFTSPLVTLFQLVYQRLRQCCDRGCTCDYTQTKKMTKTEYIELYTGPELILDMRYAQLLSTITITFLYSSGMPILYLVCFLNLGILYFTDKTMLMCFYRKPPVYNSDLHTIATRYLILIPLFHCIFAVVVFGNAQIFSQNSAVQLFSYYWQNDSNGSNPDGTTNLVNIFLTRLTNRSQNLVFLILIVLLILYYVLGFLFTQVLLRIKNFFCKGTNNQQSDDQYNKLYYYNYMNSKDLKEDQKLIEWYMQKQKNNSSSQFQNMLQERYTELQNQIELRQNLQSTQKSTSKFLGPYSYDIRLDNNYRQLLKWEQDIQSHNSVEPGEAANLLGKTATGLLQNQKTIQNK